MRHAECLLLLVPILALAAGTANRGTVVAPGVPLHVVNGLPGDGRAGSPGPQSSPGPSREARFKVGTVDTVGGTTYDYATNGPAYRMLVRTPGKGVHVVWMWSTDADTNFPNRYLRYNFYDENLREWNWPDPEFMQAGVNVFAVRTGYGSMDVDTSGVAVVSAHHATSGLAPIVARDADVGAGIFDYAPGEPVIDRYVWPYVAVGTNNYYHLAMIDDPSRDNLYWSRIVTWPGWEEAEAIASPQPDPLFPTQNIATSKVPGSNKVCITWVGTPASGYQQDPGFFRESRDGGDNWDPPVDLGYPPAFHPGSETLPSYHVSSLFPFYDREDRLHIVGNLSPYVRDTNWVLPGQIWHWCAANPDTWDLVHLASPDSWKAGCGNNAMVCCRPSLGQDGDGALFISWEEFDGVNVESATNLLRADIWCSRSTDNGVTWADGFKITDGGSVSYRFPSILDPIGDTVMVTYLIDQVAGFFVQEAEGPATNNPVVVHFLKYSGIEGPRVAPPVRMEVVVSPSPARGRAGISYALPQAGEVSLVVYDAAGRPFKTLVSGFRSAGRHTAAWDARAAAAGVYFCTLDNGRGKISRKVVLTE